MRALNHSCSPRLYLALALVAPAFYACNSPERGVEGASCPNDQNCRPGLRCIDGTCQPDPGNPPMDMGVVMMMDMGQPPPPPVMDMGQPPDMGMIVKETEDEFNAGAFNLTPTGEMRTPDLEGTAGMMRVSGSETSVLLEISGLPAGEYPSHVHAQPCAMEFGGPHYQIDPMVMEVLEENEIWPNVTIGPDGSGRGTALVEHLARPEAQSVVIHDPDDGERLACADLNPGGDRISRGTFEELPAGMGLNISGTVTMRRWSLGGTEVNVLVTGDLPMAIHPAHVHNQPCAQEAGGAHYQIDRAVMEVVEENEIWPVALVDMDGRGQGNAYVPHVARHDAYSVVVHDPDTGDRLACADLNWQ